ncbi:SGNH/GDSL hydrolase family protein [Plantactinospora sp. GCM10030261]|uniref:golvesin C-terminal-like domain-containing protein n=1 Tax=Plantactinospora sp. GCM10030261 TaxID=3273420 RepID=UPI00360EAB54
MLRHLVAAVVGCLTVVSSTVVPVHAARPTAPAAPAPTTAAPPPSTVDPAQRDTVLPHDWRSSPDVAWTTSGDATGLHVLVADSRSGYTWRTAATLTEPGLDTDRWIGNACLTGSGRRIVVVYAPRQFTNRAELFDRGAFAAVVDLGTGAVRKLGIGSTLAYFNPGCGAAETAVLTQAGQDLGKTRLHWLDAPSGRLSLRAELPGQATSAVPVGDRVVTAYDGGFAQIDPTGRRSPFATTTSLPFRVRADAGGGVVFLQQHGKTALARRATPGVVTDLARGPLGQVGVSGGAGGRVFLTGGAVPIGPLPAGVSRVDAAPAGDVSSLGQLVVRHAAARAGDPLPAELAPRADGQRAVRLDATVVATRRAASFLVRPAPVNGTAAPGSGAAAKAGVRAAVDEPWDGDRACAVARNDPATRAYQPHWNQVEWAANLAVRDALAVGRPTNWKGTGLPAWTPQGMFGSIDLIGGGTVPPQILLGVLAQESNLWQASRHTVEGLTGNPLIGNFYGLAASGADGYDPSEWDINWAKSDCGYGVGQVTDGMRLSDTGMTATKKRAIALDYATNIAAALQILQSKWNQTRSAGIVINDGDPRWPENWWAAVWAYNTGMNPSAKTGNPNGCAPSPTCTDADGNWGLGYTNNLANASYPRDRNAFLETDPDDARHPQDWSYPEKVLGWAAFPIIKVELTDPGEWQAGFAPAWWLTNTDRHNAIQPPLDLFCTAAIHCDINRAGEACARADFHCWWNKPVTWKSNCQAQCGYATPSYAAGDPEPAGAEGRNYPPECGPGPLPSTAIVVDDTPVAPVRGCSRPNLGGTFDFWFAQDGAGEYRSKIDLHQVGAGWGDHFWFSHTWNHPQNAHEIKGTWTPNLPRTGWYRVLAKLPDHGAHTRTALYTVSLADGTTRSRVVNQFSQDRRGTWADIGSFRLAPGSDVTLTNLYNKGDGTWDVAWDAMAFVPLAGKPYTYVALGDSYASGEGNEPYEHNSDFRWRGQEDRCHRAAADAFAKRVSHNGVRIAEHARGTELYEFHFESCAGATTVAMTDAAVDRPDENTGESTPWRGEDWRFGEEQQLERGYLDEDTDLVTITMGGNDMSYSTVLQGCALMLDPFDDCLDDGFRLERNGRVDPLPLRQYQPHVIDLTMTKLRTVYEEITRRAPRARVVVLGYPALFSAHADRDVDCTGAYGTITNQHLDWFNEMATLFENTLADLVLDMRAAGRNIRYLSLNPEFVGHRLCERGGDDPWLHDFSYLDPSFSGAFHPNPEGQAAFARAAQHGKDMA